ncbi:MAG: hypothetical protein M9899_00680 [Bdellovibrionaceae bacterium]|nr:hypothetical protein [Pseudobdellovibrionaceae bacterium]
MKKIALIMTIMGLVTACTSDSGTPSFTGNPSTRGFCGRPDQPYKNPITNDIDPEEYEVVAEIEAGEYAAEQVLVYYRESESDLESPQALGVQGHVFLNDTFAQKTFIKDCARGLEFGSEGKHEVTLPIKVQLNADKTWKTIQAAKYAIEYSPKLSEGLVFKAELDESASPASDDRDYVETMVIMSAKPAKINDVFEPKSYEEFRDLYIKSRFLDRVMGVGYVDVTREYDKYLKREERKHKKLLALNEKPRKIFLQIEAQSDPKIYARIQISKVKKVEEKSED